MPQASALVPLWERAAEWQCRLSMIEAAQTFLYLATFYIEYDAYGIQILDALRRAQRRGVSVTLLVDGFGQRLGGVLMTPDQRAALNRELDAVRADGGVVQVYAPAYRVQRLLGGGQHVKDPPLETPTGPVPHQTGAAPILAARHGPRAMTVDPRSYCRVRFGLQHQYLAEGIQLWSHQFGAN